MNGILVIDKDKNKTSRDIVNEVCHILHTKKVGHTGTLDPIATGVLVLCIGEATKLVEVLTSLNKTYIATVILGKETDTLDITGITLKEENINYNEQEIDTILQSFLGIYEQEVPLYSAIKINGKKLYQYAREKKDISLPKREVTITKIERITPLQKENGKIIFSFICEVSKGTYIRSLIRDIALKLNTIGCMQDLRRIRQGTFEIKDAIKVSSLTENTTLLSISEALKTYPKEYIEGDFLFKIQNGNKIFNTYQKDYILFCTKQNIPIALYKIDEKDKKLLKPWKMFKGGNI